MAKITGLGGLFYKVADPARTRAWYEEMLGIGGEHGAMLRHDEVGAYSIFAPFAGDTGYFKPSDAQFMVNLRTDDLDGLIASLTAKGVEILGRQDEPYGLFASILDCDGIKIELWQQTGEAP